MCIYVCILLLGLLLFRGCRLLTWLCDGFSWRAEHGHGALWVRGLSHVARLSVRSVLCLTQADFVEFGTFIPPCAPAVWFYHLTCWAYATACWSRFPYNPVPLHRDLGWQNLGTWAPMLGW